ncbi:MAG TPA: phosphomethylpyrimidine synthase ThiC [Candidatus Aminicenantes bacterium]|nr:phosphomethylpyrimidine synthase ThiC [Candidatus Aminicenantes bacterium]HPB54571.1 phosphomethylpyrimidine synthase ThiC [Candidatus Aminicenantes bacterium]HPS99998.1 phosphomethylpyrimidine synthase ThiC [Candidatus Aminicenantes bacterium]
MTQLQKARRQETTPEMERVAAKEGLLTVEVRHQIAEGKVVIPANVNHKNLEPMGIGEGMTTKINANIGTSLDFPDQAREIEKMETAVRYGAHTIMDLSTGGKVDEIRRQILSRCSVPLGTVPIYQVATETIAKRKAIVDMNIDDILDVIRRQAEDGVDFMTIHAGLTLHAVERIKKQNRLMGVVSRGGSFLTAWIMKNQKENPFYEHFDKILDIAEEYDVTMSLGDALRPGSLYDATDRPQIDELIILGELVDRCRERGVQVMVEGPGHVPLDQIVTNVKLEKRLAHGAPFYVLGPLVTDVAPGYDHIVGAIGGAIAASAGADYLCYVTPAEHLGLPGPDEVRQGVIASLIAAHAADIMKFPGRALQWDDKMSQARRSLDWKAQRELAIDPDRFDEIRNKYKSSSDACSMCGDLCALKIVDECFGINRSGYKKQL